MHAVSVASCVRQADLACLARCGLVFVSVLLHITLWLAPSKVSRCCAPCFQGTCRIPPFAYSVSSSCVAKRSNAAARHASTQQLCWFGALSRPVYERPMSVCAFLHLVLQGLFTCYCRVGGAPIAHPECSCRRGMCISHGRDRASLMCGVCQLRVSVTMRWLQSGVGSCYLWLASAAQAVFVCCFWKGGRGLCLRAAAAQASYAFCRLLCAVWCPLLLPCCAAVSWTADGQSAHTTCLVSPSIRLSDSSDFECVLWCLGLQL